LASTRSSPHPHSSHSLAMATSDKGVAAPASMMLLMLIY